MQDLYNIEAIDDIHRIFTEINAHKTFLRELPGIKAKYADIVNELVGIYVEDSEAGEALSWRAKELCLTILKAEHAKSDIRRLENELKEKYGFLASMAEQAIA